VALDIFTTGVLARVVAPLEIDPAAFFLNSFFRTEQVEESEEIHFDVTDEQPRISPFVSPLKAGRIVEHEGYTTNTFKPAYIKDKRIWDPDSPIKRVAGEQPLGSLSASERTQRLLAHAVANQNRMLTRREEVMASEILRTGKVTISGEGFDDAVVDFGRVAALTVADLTGTAKWSDTTGSDPVGDIETWAGLIQDNNGGVARDVIMAPDVWGYFRQNTKVTNLLETRRGSTSRAETGPLAANRVRNPGSIGDFNIWIYSDVYINEAGTAGNMMPSGSVIVINGNDLEGVRHYGMVKDYAASHRASRLFLKSWVEEDPSRRLLLMQSAPLVVPYRPNASLFCDVLNG
jgi:hypothetical protein